MIPTYPYQAWGPRAQQFRFHPDYGYIPAGPSQPYHQWHPRHGPQSNTPGVPGPQDMQPLSSSTRSYRPSNPPPDPLHDADHIRAQKVWYMRNGAAIVEAAALKNPTSLRGSTRSANKQRLKDWMALKARFDAKAETLTAEAEALGITLKAGRTLRDFLRKIPDPVTEDSTEPTPPADEGPGRPGMSPGTTESENEHPPGCKTQ
ncbi:hypothetical protein EG327_006477 [Venturia inaequalis]|uniref:Uncharacterized protein n=1 Tax=Venturia inaequalis TaxID=5025 RepID=A0A8H3V3U0_VENIN|nr:hypothetical protein EG327_006477 [Venturia inaequalis]